MLQEIGGCFFCRQDVFGADPEAKFIVGKAVCEIGDEDIQKIFFRLIEIAGMHTD